MKFFGHWVPRELGTELLILGIVGVAIAAAVMHWLGRRRPPEKKSQHELGSARARRRRGHRKSRVSPSAAQRNTPSSR